MHSNIFLLLDRVRYGGCLFFLFFTLILIFFSFSLLLPSVDRWPLLKRIHCVRFLVANSVRYNIAVYVVVDNDGGSLKHHLLNDFARLR
jgi:glucan phosphoethanolaminetransferase (alkaline phosphatase superfamily)